MREETGRRRRAAQRKGHGGEAGLQPGESGRRDLRPGSQIALPRAQQPLAFTGERFVPEVVGDIAQEHIHRYLFALGLCRDRDVLDLACGEGYGAAMLSRVARRIFGVDNDRAAIAHAQATYGADHVTFITGTAEFLPLTDASVDIVVCFETLEHVSEQARMLSEIRRVLRPGGLLLVSTPDRPLYTPEGKQPNPFHAKELDRGEFVALLAEFFGQARLYRQKLTAGSAIVAEANAGSVDRGAPPAIFAKSGEGEWTYAHEIEDGVYMIAVAGDRLPELPDASLLIDYSKIWSTEAALASANARLAGAEAERERARSAIDEMQARLADAQRAAGEAQVQTRDSQAALEAALQRATTGERLCEALRQQAGALEQELENARASLEQRKHELDAATLRARKLEQDLAQARHEMDASQRSAAEAQARARVAEERHQELAARLEALEAARSQLGSELEAARASLEATESRAEATTALLGQRQNELDAAVSRAAELERQIAQVRHELESSQKAAAEAQAHATAADARHDEQVARLQELDAARNTVGSELGTVRSALQSAERRAVAAEAEARSAGEREQSVRAELAELKQQLASAQDAASLRAREVQELTQTLSDHQRQQADVGARIAALEGELATARHEIHERQLMIDRSMSAANATSQLVEERSAALAVLEAELEETRRQAHQNFLSAEAASQREQELSEGARALEQRVLALDAELSRARAQVVTLRSTTVRLRESLEASNARERDLAERLRGLVEASRESEQERTAAVAAAADASVNARDAKRDGVALKRRLEEIESALQEARATARDSQAATRVALEAVAAGDQRVAAVTNRLEALGQEVDQSRAEVGRLERELARTAAHRQELRGQLVQVALRMQSARDPHEAGRVRSLEPELQRQGVVPASAPTPATRSQRQALLSRRLGAAETLSAWRGRPSELRALARALADNRLFDAEWYRERHMQGGSLLAPRAYFLLHGVKSDHSPHPLFEPDWYRRQRGPAIASRQPAIVDYLAEGAASGAMPHPLFDTRYYLEQAPDARADGLTPLGHYLGEGCKALLSPSPLFDPRWYISQAPAGYAQGADPLLHLLRSPAAAPASPHRLFDCARYLSHNGHVAASGLHPLLHYVHHGASEGLSPHLLFDGAWYNAKYGALDCGRSGLAHYLAEGERRGFWPSPLFDPVWYRAQYGARMPGFSSALEHYLAVGRANGCWPNPLFDAHWYLDTYHDVRDCKVDPFEHYLWNGEREKRRPNALFDPRWYLDQYPEVAADNVSPLHHYLTVGQHDGRRPAAGFDPADYLAANPVLALDGAAPFAHYVRQGRNEGRPLRPADPQIVVRPEGRREGADGEDRPGSRGEIATHMSLPAADGSWEWSEYAALKAHRAQVRRRNIEQLTTTPLEVFKVDPSDLGRVAREVRIKCDARPLVTILVPVFNNIALTLECLASIGTHTEDVSYEVIVADDASTDETAEIIPLVAGARHVRQSENLNFLRNCNAAAKAARGRYLVILNNDAQVTPGWLSALVSAFESAPDIGAVGPKFVYPNGRLQEAGALLNPDGTAGMIGLFDDPSLPRYNFRRQVDYCSGACLLVETHRFLTMGGFSADLAPAYCEDSDLCLRLREDGLKILYEPGSVVVHHLSRTTAAVDNSFKMRAVVNNQQKLLSRWQEDLERLNDIRILAFYLPQFHPIPENDRWWGRGFTEWRNVGKAFPNFVGHYQPRRPADLGYYDLRLPDVMEQQAALARRYGISGFCFYYYWFAGHRLLERPIEQMLASGRPQFPFCLCWANENWTRRWDGESQHILMGQAHSPEDDLAVITDLARYFRSPSYIRIDGRPLLLVYRVSLFPDFRSTVEIWRRYCRQNGIGEIYVAMVEAFDQVDSGSLPDKFGCDAGVEFPPHGFGNLRKPKAPLLNPAFEGTTDDFVELVNRYLDRPLAGYRRFRSVMAGWDNTPRRQNHSLVFERATPGAFQVWLEEVLRQTREHAHGDERIVFVNAWNEWAEGAYLEPDLRFGHTWLEAVRNARDAVTMLRSS